ncbi:SLC13 family permease [Legionella sp. CNM-4043-24]|uniref:SLC13 family permease n=1 Tax=Legionella sp. CNM-4043-24 TaxID=3421646 RepID=UPI00403B09B6
MTKNGKSPVFAVAGWISTVAVSLLAIILVHHSALNWASSSFMVVFSAALAMWIFRLVPESVPAIFVIASTMLLNFSPQRVILSGFVSDSFFFAISLFAIGYVLVKSRFFYRISIMLLSYLPSNNAFLQKMMFGLGLLLTPLISVQSSRVALMAPFLDDILAGAQIEARSTGANALASAAFNGCILLSSVFLTGKSSNAILYAMLSGPGQQPFGWFRWLQAASLPGMLLILLFFILQRVFFRHNQPMSMNTCSLKEELLSLGVLSPNEKAAMASICSLLAGLYLSSFYHISSVWTCLTVFAVLFSTGALSRHELLTKINWTFLFYLGGIIGIMRYIQDIGVDLWLAHNLTWLAGFAGSDTALFITCVFVISWLAGFVLGTMTAPAILFTVLLPVAEQVGINGWLVAFVVLMATEAWIFPYQSSYFLCFEEMLKQKKNVHLNPLLQINAWMVMGRLGVLLASIPFWRWIGIV